MTRHDALLLLGTLAGLLLGGLSCADVTAQQCIDACKPFAVARYQPGGWNLRWSCQCAPTIATPERAR